MGKFVFLYTGGQMADTPEAQKAAMDAWMGWFGTLGDDIVDPGNPFGASSTVKSDGSPRTAPPAASGATRSSRPTACPRRPARPRAARSSPAVGRSRSTKRCRCSRWRCIAARVETGAGSLGEDARATASVFTGAEGLRSRRSQAGELAAGVVVELLLGDQRVAVAVHHDIGRA